MISAFEQTHKSHYRGLRMGKLKHTLSKHVVTDVTDVTDVTGSLCDLYPKAPEGQTYVSYVSYKHVLH